MREKIAVMTFDDAVSNHATYVMPLLKAYGFGATFYVTEFIGDKEDRFDQDKHQYMTWEQIASLDKEGFEVGNHSGHHSLMRDLTDAAITAELELIERRCAEHGITAPKTFCYPCGVAGERASALIRARGYRFARITGDRPFIPEQDDPMLVPSFVIKEQPQASLEEALRTTEDVNGVCVLTFHGIPDYNHPWVSLSPERFQFALDLLKNGGWKVIAMRDIEKHL